MYTHNMRIYTPPDAVLVPDRAVKVFEGVIYNVYQWEQDMFDGSQKTFEMIKRPDTVEIIAVHEGKIIVSNEEQPHAGSFVSLPAGMHDVPEEDELTAAKRELREETGYSFKNWKLISTKTWSNKIEQIVYYFLATELDLIEKQDLDLDGERIEVMPVAFDAYKAMKNDPCMKFYPSHIMDELSSLDELLDLPALYEYK